jgi:hypothetical protein
MCEGHWNARLRRWVSLEELEERDQEIAHVERVALPPILLATSRRKPVAILR